LYKIINSINVETMSINNKIKKIKIKIIKNQTIKITLIRKINQIKIISIIST